MIRTMFTELKDIKRISVEKKNIQLVELYEVINNDVRYEIWRVQASEYIL